MTHYPTIIFDGNGIGVRAFMPNRDTTGAVLDTVSSFLWRLAESAERWTPEVMICCWDAPDSRKARLKYLPEYKTNREKKDPDMLEAFGLLERTLPVLGVLQVKVPGVEADDSMYSLSIEKAPCLIYSADKDLLQALEPEVHIYRPPMGRKEEQLCTLETCEALTGLDPAAWTGYLALNGDSSDNIPGIKGCGDKTAKRILAACPDFVEATLGDPAKSHDATSQALAAADTKLLKWFDKATGDARDGLEASYNAVQLILCDTDEHTIPAAPDRARAEATMHDLGCSDHLIAKWSALVPEAAGEDW